MYMMLLEKKWWSQLDHGNFIYFYTYTKLIYIYFNFDSVSVGGKIFHAAPYFYKTVPTPKCHSFVSVVSLKELRLQNNHLYRTIVNDTLQLASDNIIGAHLSAKYNLAQVNDAIKYIDERKCTGKVLIHMDS